MIELLEPVTLPIIIIMWVIAFFAMLSVGFLLVMGLCLALCDLKHFFKWLYGKIDS